MKHPCDQCPWRLSNQGTRHVSGFQPIADWDVNDANELIAVVRSDGRRLRIWRGV
jgi:hypothetical protein